SFVIMLCLGGVYAWSIFVPDLMNEYNFSAFQTQLIFGVLIAIFPATMIVAGKIEQSTGARFLAILSAGFWVLGYLLAGYSEGNFLMIFLGIGVLAGIGTGFGYLAAITTPVKTFPEKKGLVTGVAAAGFGLAAVVMSFIAENLSDDGQSVLYIFKFIGILYGIVILLFSLFIYTPPQASALEKTRVRQLMTRKEFYKLFSGILCGTFGGLLVIGNLKTIGSQHPIEEHILVMGVSAFAVANFTGRLFWGFLSDFTGSKLSIVLALSFQAISIFLIGAVPLTSLFYILLSVSIGFGFGANFVLFARETSQVFGVHNLGSVYPYVFLGYALAGIFGPITAGLILDTFNSFAYATLIASIISLTGAMLFLSGRQRLEMKEEKPAS
ncbi:MAG: MFS transporter, partial [Candidatus Hydrogenedentota bacterium]